MSKPPAPCVAGRVIQAAATCGKPVGARFLGADPTATTDVPVAATLAEAAEMAAHMLNTPPVRTPEPESDGSAALTPAGRFIRGLYSG